MRLFHQRVRICLFLRRVIVETFLQSRHLLYQIAFGIVQFTKNVGEIIIVRRRRCLRSIAHLCHFVLDFSEPGFQAALQILQTVRRFLHLYALPLIPLREQQI